MITTLSQLIAQVESSGNPYAVRFEASYSPGNSQIIKMQSLARCTLATAGVLCKISWGLFQIMGDNLVDLGLDMSPIAYCSEKIEQLNMFNAYCVANDCVYTLEDVISNASKRLDFARKYNGPGDPVAYAAAMMNAYQDAQNG